MKINREKVKKRKSYYGFAKNYPGKLGSSKYVIGDSRDVKKRESIRRILITVILILLFIASFIATTVGLEISEKPMNNDKTASISVDMDAVF